MECPDKLRRGILRSVNGEGNAMTVADLQKKDYAKRGRATGAALRKRGLFNLQIGADGHVVAAFLPLAGNVVVLRAFRDGAFGHGCVRNLRHVAVVAGKLDAVERYHLRGRDRIDFSSARCGRPAA